MGLLYCSAQTAKSAITINYPTKGTVWSIPELVKLEWDVAHIAATKSTRFFLVRDEMVVQDLGSYENTGFKEGIALEKNIGSGDRYQVVGIELFPDDKYNIAKYVTPFFSIVNAASDARKKERERANQPLVVSKKNKKSKKHSKAKTTAKAITSKAEETKTAVRDSFDGRKISYTKELTFNNEDISIKIWDHGRQDGDIVSIFLNGTSIVSKHYLTYLKREFKVKLDATKSNDLFLYAHNLGYAPPNTVSIEITDGTTSENIILNSDLKSCEAVMISVRQ